MKYQQFDDRESNRRGARRRQVLALALALSAGTGVFAWNQLSANDSKHPPINLNVSEKAVTRQNGITTFSPVVKKVTPSVVKVFVTGKARNVAHQLPEGLEDNPLLRRFFGEQFNERRMPAPRQRGMGSGVIVTKDGYLLTNNHVVENADEVTVALADGREFQGKVIGKDPKSDIAVLKIDARDLPAVEFANSDNIEVGDVVLAIGNPFGVGQTVTTGIVSATGRGSLGLDYEDMIQTDAAINPGNSGGALVDADGRLIGINTAILSQSGGNQGIGFAVPVNLARSVMESLVAEGRVVRGFMGVNVQDVTPALAREFGLKERSGALVAGVTPKSPAEKAGLQSGDVVVEFNGRAVKDSRNLKLQVAQTSPGKTVPVKVLRDGKSRALNLTVKELPNTDLAANDATSNGSSGDALDGVVVGEIDPATREQLKMPRNIDGAVVKQVEPTSRAFESGLRPGDVIVEINRKPVSNADEAVKLTENAREKRTLLRVWSKGGTRYLVVDEMAQG